MNNSKYGPLECPRCHVIGKDKTKMNDHCCTKDHKSSTKELNNKVWLFFFLFFFFCFVLFILTKVIQHVCCLGSL